MCALTSIYFIFFLTTKFSLLAFSEPKSTRGKSSAHIVPAFQQGTHNFIPPTLYPTHSTKRRPTLSTRLDLTPIVLSKLPLPILFYFFVHSPSIAWPHRPSSSPRDQTHTFHHLLAQTSPPIILIESNFGKPQSGYVPIRTQELRLLSRQWRHYTTVHC